MSETNLIPVARIERRILFLRGQKVMLDFDLAELYGVETRTLNQAVQRNLERFPEDFMFQLSAEEADQILRSQSVISNAENTGVSSKTPTALRSQSVISKQGKGGRRYRPYAFTEQGIGMLSGVLNSPRAIQVHVAIIRTFVQLRLLLATHADLARKLESLERKYDKQFRGVFDAIRALMADKKKPKREIGFHAVTPKKNLQKN